MNRPTINYYFTGMIERGNGKPGYDWAQGYSPKLEGKLLYPSMTYRECQREAKAVGLKAAFVTCLHDDFIENQDGDVKCRTCDLKVRMEAQGEYE